jgi:hypothetical protein
MMQNPTVFDFPIFPIWSSDGLKKKIDRIHFLFVYPSAPSYCLALNKSKMDRTCHNNNKRDFG